MAISILSTTTAHLTQASYHVSVPATTAGSTLIVSVTSSGGTSNFPYGVGDDQQGFPYYSNPVSGTRTDSSVRRTSSIWYRTDVPAGITDVFIVPNDSSGMNMWACIFEVSGVNVATPFETGSCRTITDASTFNTSGNACVTAFTNAFFVGNGVRNVSAELGSNTNSFVREYHAELGTTASIHSRKVASGSQTLNIDHAFGSGGMLISIAAFNPTPNAYTLGLNDGVTPDAAIVNEAGFEAELDDGFSLSAAIDAVLGTNGHFKNLFDTLTLAVSVATAAAYSRLLQDGVTTADAIAFVKEVFRTKTETINLQDWLRVRKTNSSNWGS